MNDKKPVIVGKFWREAFEMLGKKQYITYNEVVDYMNSIGIEAERDEPAGDHRGWCMVPEE